MNETLDSYTELILKHAYVALRKVKKPSDYDIDDLTQEGAGVFLGVRKIYEEGRGCSFRSFLVMCLRQHFGSLILRSYRDRKTTNLEVEGEDRYRTSKISHSAFDIVSMMYVLDDFSSDELEYVRTILSFMDKPTKYRRKLTRVALGISYEREGELRRSIHDKIRK